MSSTYGSLKPDSKIHQQPISQRSVFWIVLIAIFLLAANMRSPIVALGSISPVVQKALSINEIHIGWLGAIPMLMFALGALISPSIGKRFGIENTLIMALVGLTLGMIIRSWYEGWAGFLIGTVLLSFAIGFANTLAAPIIKQHTPNHIALITGVYSLSMTVMAGVISGVVFPLSEAVGWQWALGGWASLSILAIFIWSVLRVKLGSSHHISKSLDTTHHLHDSITIWRASFAWQLATFMGIQSLLYYTVASFLPSIWVSKGLTQQQGGNMASVFHLMAPIAITSITWLTRRGSSIQITAVVAGCLNVIGVVGISYLPPSLAWAWTASIGLGCACIFTLSIMLFSLRTYTPNQASRLSGMVQTIAYFMAFFGPLGTGWLFERSNSWDTPMFIMLIFMLINVVFAWLASRPIMIDGKAA